MGDFMKVLENPGIDTEAHRAVHADGAGSVPLRAIRAVPAADSGRQRVRRSRDPFADQPERVRRPGHAGRAVRAHGLARAAGGRPAAEAAADVPALTKSSAATAEQAYEDSLADLCRTLEADVRRARRAIAGAARLHGARAATASASWTRGATGRSR